MLLLILCIKIELHLSYIFAPLTITSNYGIRQVGR